jgi:TolB-like protein
MKRKKYMMLASVLFLFTGMSSLPGWAGQFATPEFRDWAKEAVRQEGALATQKSDKRTLAVLYFHNKTGLPALNAVQKGLAIMIITDLAKANIKKIALVERGRFQALVEELDLGMSGLVAPEQAPRVGRLLGAHLLVGGHIEQNSQRQFQVHSGVMNVPSETMLGEPIVEGKLLEELFRIEKDLLFEIIRLLNIELTPAVRADLKENLTDSLDALLYYFRAIDAVDAGHLEDANELLEKSLNEDPDFGLPGEAKKEIARILPSGESCSTGSTGQAESGSIRKECAAARNKIKRNVFRSRRRF